MSIDLKKLMSEYHDLNKEFGQLTPTNLKKIAQKIKVMIETDEFRMVKFLILYRAVFSLEQAIRISLPEIETEKYRSKALAHQEDSEICEEFVREFLEHRFTKEKKSHFR